MTSLKIRSFKDRTPFAVRQSTASTVKESNVGKVPVIIERYYDEKSLPIPSTIKYIIPSDMTISKVIFMVRQRLCLRPDQAIFFIVNGHTLPCMSHTIGEIYARERDEDGYLYVVYASQETFGQ